MQAIPGNVQKGAKNQVVINQCIKLALLALLALQPFFASKVWAEPCRSQPLYICWAVIKRWSTGGQVRHLGQGMHTAVTSRIHCPRFKEFKDVETGLEASLQVTASQGAERTEGLMECKCITENFHLYP